MVNIVKNLNFSDKKILNYIETIYNDREIEHKNAYNGAFIDVGLRNFCIRISKFENDLIKTIYQHNYHFNTDNEASDLSELSKELVKITDLFKLCDFVAIEGQIRHKAERNVRIMYYTIGCVQCIVPDVIIYEIKPKAKTQLLEAPTGMINKEHKDWCYFFSIRIMTCNIYGDDEERKLVWDDVEDFKKDLEILELMKNLKKTGLNKRDDHGDVVCYCFLFWRILLPSILMRDKNNRLHKIFLEYEKENKLLIKDETKIFSDLIKLFKKGHKKISKKK